MNFLRITLFTLITPCTFAQTVSNGASTEYLNHPVDVKHYQVSTLVSDTNDVLMGHTTIQFVLTEAADSFFIDLQSVNGSVGMEITQPITVNAREIVFRHADNRIWIQSAPDWIGNDCLLSIHYKGIPETGLIIGKNKFDDRTFFGDNWPNRAHHWFPCVDHPSDKATVSFDVTAPDHYDCIATGILKKKSSVKPHSTLFQYETSIELPTKVMVIGLADFKTKKYKSDLPFPVTAWAYPKDAKAGFQNMEIALDVTSYFIETIGDYPYEKLANVQSTTQFGGMENAGNIFYDENSVPEEERMGSLVAHEIAHQWFGNSASELDWPHIWLSEGFATYFTDLFWEHAYGVEEMNNRLYNERITVINFAKRYDHPVVDTSYADLMKLLNPNSYQKGAWVLHMLRNEIGDEAFFNGIRNYYDRFKLSNATTDDLKMIMEATSGEDLTAFFDQWLYASGHPKLYLKSGVGHGGWEYVTIEQMQSDKIFEFDLEIEIVYQDGSTELMTCHMDQKEQKFTCPRKKEIQGFNYDPNTKLLFEEVEY